MAINIVGKGSNVELVNGRPETVDGRLEKEIIIDCRIDKIVVEKWF